MEGSRPSLIIIDEAIHGPGRGLAMFTAAGHETLMNSFHSSWTARDWDDGLDDEETFVAQVLGHEYSAVTMTCSCGWLDEQGSFVKHVRRVISRAEQELPKRVRPLPPVLEAKRKRDEERRQRLEGLTRGRSSR